MTDVTDRLAAIEAEILQRRAVTQTLFHEAKFDAMQANEAEIRRLQREKQSLRTHVNRAQDTVSLGECNR